jgi:hypothetical protein
MFALSMNYKTAELTSKFSLSVLGTGGAQV